MVRCVIITVSGKYRAVRGYSVRVYNLINRRYIFYIVLSERKSQMARIIAITNQKGGVGKTTTAINLSACLAEAGQHVLLVDFDPQGNASSGLGLEREDIENTVYDLLTEEVTFEECRIAEIQKNLDILPSDMNLAGAEIEFQEIEDKEKLLRSYLEKIKDDYDFILIDCPPSLNILTINALTAADTVLVPIPNDIPEKEEESSYARRRRDGLSRVAPYQRESLRKSIRYELRSPVSYTHLKSIRKWPFTNSKRY